jgi:hypothetical protein
MDNALCGGAGQSLSGDSLRAVKAAIFMGDPRNVAGLSYNVGTCKAKGVRCHLLCGLALMFAVLRSSKRLQLRFCQ